MVSNSHSTIYFLFAFIVSSRMDSFIHLYLRIEDVKLETTREEK
jgi:hypothetical protein